MDGLAGIAALLLSVVLLFCARLLYRAAVNARDHEHFKRVYGRTWAILVGLAAAVFLIMGALLLTEGFAAFERPYG